MAELPVPGVEESQPRGHRFWPYKTLHGWIVALAAIDTDDGPTFVTEQGAEDWAERLNAREVVPAEQLAGAVEALRAIHHDAKYLAEGAWNEEGSRLVAEKFVKLAAPYLGHV